MSWRPKDYIYNPVTDKKETLTFSLKCEPENNEGWLLVDLHLWLMSLINDIQCYRAMHKIWSRTINSLFKHTHTHTTSLPPASGPCV